MAAGTGRWAYTSRWSYRYFALSNGVEVTWAPHPRSCLYHAVMQGTTSLCGVHVDVDGKVESIPASCSDPSDDTMTCMKCQGLVRRVLRSCVLEGTVVREEK